MYQIFWLKNISDKKWFGKKYFGCKYSHTNVLDMLLNVD